MNLQRLRRLTQFGACIAITCEISVGYAPAEVQTPEAANKPGLTIVLTRTPTDTPSDATIYVAGSFNNWQTADPAYRLTADGHGQYSITLPASVRGHVEFKFTLGSWDSVELEPNGAETPNRSIDIPASGGAAYSGIVQNWHLPAQSIAELKREIEKVLAQTHTPGLAVTIVRRDGPEWVAGMGLADVASGRRATADTLFRIGSVSKGFAALAILKLVDEGRLSLQDPVRRLAPEVWFENRWENSDPVRVVDLLEHTTGWDDMHGREYAKDGPGITLADALAYDHQSRRSRWRPGTRMAYCNSGPAVAAYIVEKLTGQRFEDYVAQNFFEPMGMRTATYFQPPAAQSATLYHLDGRSPFAYWNIIFRPAGAINASANDLAAYLSFYLHRGEVNGKSVTPATAIERMELPTRNWAARRGMKFGYGLYNYTTLDGDLVYHGHDGGVNGGLTKLVYLPDAGVGYAFSINSGNGEALGTINRALRSYVTRGLKKPALPAVGPLSPTVERYTGWYETDSPRVEKARFFERLLSLTRVRIEDGKVLARTLGRIPQEDTVFAPAGADLLRVVAEPFATAALIPPNDEGLFIVTDHQTLKRIPTWLALGEIGLTAWFLCALLLILIYSPIWLLVSIRKARRRPEEIWMTVWPFVAAMAVTAVAMIFHFVGEDIIERLGQITPWSMTLFAMTLLFAVASIASALSVWRVRGRYVRRIALAYGVVVAPALLIAMVYFTYWGMIGLRSWA
jgi:CubicO group peptidase (beta-lactamase class C family)